LNQKFVTEVTLSTRAFSTSWAAEKGYEAVVKLLLAKDGVDPNSKDYYDWAPLLWAAATKRDWWMISSKHETVVELLLANSRVDINTKDTNGRTPLSWAAGEGHCAKVRLLLAKNGIDPDNKDKDGHIAL
jgi:hypothetical protein